MTSKNAGILSLAEELRCHILSFLPYRDILRCTSVCKALRQTFTSSSVLQYIVELGGQGLLPVPDTEFNKHVPTSKRLQLLKDNAHAWFKFNIYPVSIRDHFTIGPVPVQGISFADGHLCLFDEYQESAKIFPIVSKPSAQTKQRDWSPESLLPVPRADVTHVWMDPAQNLIAIGYEIVDRYHNNMDLSKIPFYIDLKVLDGDDVHPQAAGQTLFLSELRGCHGDAVKLSGLGRHIALQRGQGAGEWWMQIWEWQHSTTSDCVMSYQSNAEDENFCFLGNDRLLIISSESLDLLSIEDISQAPRLLRCFFMPGSVIGKRIEYIAPADDIAHGPQPQMRAHEIAWTSDPEHRLLSFVMDPPSVAFVVSTMMFFNLDLFDGTDADIPWEHWGPSHSHVFYLPNRPHSFGVSGNRVFQIEPVVEATEDNSSHGPKYSSHMMDFSPLAVHRRQGRGRVVKEPSTIALGGELITTSLPYVEILSDGKYRDSTSADARSVVKMWVNKDEVYVPRVSPSKRNGALKQAARVDMLQGVEAIIFNKLYRLQALHTGDQPVYEIDGLVTSLHFIMNGEEEEEEVTNDILALEE
ncbi:uncharacterized protein EDB93DRAFT_1247105 [Suillus bovinus]|uniref:uncharacterized protein n=1 Tax=Suillus bovinus TaxID=48563 RepID=UPI001B861B50|nr:uncharacterized protein EDB93DRAFT_1247105 [Suillus bovinus]KAG2156924.1 hypothetical protein EDB93DRAFT_1247105 [Suillus bovinus]